MEPARAIRPIPKPSLNRSWAALLAERTAWGFGLVCMVTCGALCIDAAVSARYELGRFARLQAAALEQPPALDLSLWDLEASPRSTAPWAISTARHCQRQRATPESPGVASGSGTRGRIRAQPAPRPENPY